MKSVARSIKNLILILARHIYEFFAPREIDVSPTYYSVPDSRGRIPNRVYQTWETPFIPSLLARGMRQFRRLNPDYSFTFFDARAREEYMARQYAGHPILQVFRGLKIRTAQVDVWRYCLLYKEGGVYCDVDSALRVPLNTIIRENASELISFERNLCKDLFDPCYTDDETFMKGPPPAVAERLDYPDHVVLNWMMAFEKGHPALKEAIDLIVRHFPFFQGKRFASALKAIVHCSGPLVLTQAIWNWIAASGAQLSQCGIDFNGRAILTLPGAGRRHTAANPHYVGMADVEIAHSGKASG